jgi:alanine racemase
MARRAIFLRMQIEPPPATLRLRVDHAALAGNWRALNRLSGNARAGAAVKADAYGLGARAAVPVLRDAGCTDFFVAHWREADDLRDLVPPGSLAVLHGPVQAADVRFAQQTGVKPVLNSLAQISRWIEAGGGRCDLMIDTGINRLGLPISDLGNPLLRQMEIDVLMSHLASADEDSPLNALQRARWETARAGIKHRRASLANSAGITLGSAYHGDLTRPGLALYGGVPCAALADEIVQVVAPEAALIQIREIATGESVGYNATFTATAPMRIGVVSIGYADGYLRCWSNCGKFQADGAALPVLGRVSMDMTIVDLTAAPQLREGDWLTAGWSLPEAAKRSGLSQYELLTLLGMRLDR